MILHYNCTRRGCGTIKKKFSLNNAFLFISHYKISRIRGFYMRKVKFTQQNYHDKLTTILTDFPRLEVRKTIEVAS